MTIEEEAELERFEVLDGKIHELLDKVDLTVKEFEKPTNDIEDRAYYYSWLHSIQVAMPVLGRDFYLLSEPRFPNSRLKALIYIFPHAWV
jgi:hypothetical protein